MHHNIMIQFCSYVNTHSTRIKTLLIKFKQKKIMLNLQFYCLCYIFPYVNCSLNYLYIKPLLLSVINTIMSVVLRVCSLLRRITDAVTSAYFGCFSSPPPKKDTHTYHILCG